MGSIDVKKLVMEVYDAIAEGYQHIRARPWSIVGRVRRCEEVVDVGCGTAVQPTPLLRRGGYGLCIDISRGMLLMGRRRLLRMGLYDRADLVQADAEHLPLRSSSVECLISIATLHHLPGGSRRSAVEEFTRVLKRGGRLLVTVWALYQPRFLIGLLANLFRYLLGSTPSPKDFLVPWRRGGRRYLRYYHVFTLGELLKLFRVCRDLEVLEYGVYNLKRTIFHQNYYVLGFKK